MAGYPSGLGAPLPGRGGLPGLREEPPARCQACRQHASPISAVLKILHSPFPFSAHHIQLTQSELNVKWLQVLTCAAQAKAKS